MAGRACLPQNRSFLGGHINSCNCGLILRHAVSRRAILRNTHAVTHLRSVEAVDLRSFLDDVAVGGLVAVRCIQVDSFAGYGHTTVAIDVGTLDRSGDRVVGVALNVEVVGVV
ncbi:MAG: hypothetical protein K2M65_07765, partial [Muribaculaceae bacterium]|nr:hypothetical protein [Muribaculaceae bacterium]